MLNLQYHLKTALLCLTAFICVALPAQEANTRKAIMGMANFENRSTMPEDNSKMMDYRLTKELQKNGFVKNPSRQIRNMMETQGIERESFLDQSNAARIGKLAGLDYIVLGTVLEAGAVDVSGSNMQNVSVLINVKVLEVETDKIVLSENGRGTHETVKFGKVFYSFAAERACAQIAPKILSLAPSWQAAGVVLVRDKEVAIDEGREANIWEKDKIAIVRQGERLYDQNGNFLGVDLIEIAEIKITRVEQNIAYGKITKIHKDPVTKKKHVIQIGDFARKPEYKAPFNFNSMMIKLLG